ncbi:MAG: DUF3899 domain-containing protein [Faecousia sp.]
MNWKRNLITYAALIVVAAAVVLAVTGFELSSRENGTVSAMGYLSDGFFTVSVLYIGCSILVFIQEAGNFYGIQFLFYTMVRLFSFRKDRVDEKKNYFVYCQEKKERQAAEGKSPVKSAMLLTGLGCLVLSLCFTALFYRLP